MIDPSFRSKPPGVQAQEDFARARRGAFLSEAGSFLVHRPNELLSFDEVQRQIPFKGETYRGIEAIPVNKIIGSVGRYEDFNRKFLPTQSNTRARWENVDKAVLTDIPLPPIQVYKVGDAYFVKDGNHRVSVARERGMAVVDAAIVELETKVPIGPTTDREEMLCLAERARFLEQTNLDKLRPGAHIEFTELGRYDVLIEHISAHRWYMGIEQNRAVPWETAVLDWYDNVYSPLVKIIKERRILDEFPRRKPADLYLWIMDHRYYLSQTEGRQIGPVTAVHSYNRSQVGWGRRVLGWTSKLLDYAVFPFVILAQVLARVFRATRPRRRRGNTSLRNRART